MKQFVELSLTEFDQFARDYRPPVFLQSAAMARSQQARGQQVVCYGLKQADQVIAAGLFTIHPHRKIFKIATAIGGLLMDYSNIEDIQLMFEGLKSSMAKRGVVWCSFNPPFWLQERDLEAELVEDGFDHRDWVENLQAAGFHYHGRHHDYDMIDSRFYFVKDLRAIEDSDGLMQSFDGQNRWATRKTGRMGITVRELKREELPKFVDLMEHTSERRGFDNRDLTYYESLFDEFNKQDELRVLVAELDLEHHAEELKDLRADQEAELAEATSRHEHRPTRKMANRMRVAKEAIEGYDQKLEDIERMRPDGPVLLLAGALFIRYGNTLTYLFSGAYEKYLSFNAPYAVQWAAMNWALDSGCEYYDFYITDGKHSGQEDEGVYHFKKGFGGSVVEKPGKFSVTTRPIWGKLFHQLSDLA